MIIVLMGVSGSGKTTVGSLLAATLDWPFYEGDNFHPVENIEKMRQGIPLTDGDRVGWLVALRQIIETQLAAQQSAVLSCSALKASYRTQLKPPIGQVEFVYLRGTIAQIQQRVEQRSGHFMNPALLASQFETLEEPVEGLKLDSAWPPEVLVAKICDYFNLKHAS